MANKLVITGVDDFKGLPRELSTAADPVLARAAAEARDRVRAAYPRVTGALQDGVIVDASRTDDPAVVRYTVKSTAPHAAPYEWGSQRFHTRAHHTFLPITNSERRAATAAVVEIVKAAGLTVTGDQG